MVPPLSNDRKRRRRFNYERRIALLAILTGVPGVAVALILLWTGGYESKVQWTFTVLVVVGWTVLVAMLREQVVRPLQTLANLLSALLEGDYSMRPTGGPTDDALGLAFREVQSLGHTLREQRLGALEATALLRKVMEEIDVAVFTFDHENKLRLINRAGERVLARPAERLLGLTDAELGMSECLESGDDGPRLVDVTFPGRSGRWEVRTGEFRQGGLPHRLLVLTDLSRTLREEERQAWQRLVRVLGHEINNSLAPIKSIAASLQGLLGREPRPDDLDDDLRRGLHVIAARTDALSRFMTAYARLARLPPPKPEPMIIGDLVRRVASLETRMSVDVAGGPEIAIHADADQLEQLFINIIKNAVDAAEETGGGVSIRWRREGVGQLEVHVEDQGPGLPESGNLFVPFFTTKRQGTGIGLVLSRQIAEAHGGTLALENRDPERGCRAVLRLPVGEDVGVAAEG